MQLWIKSVEKQMEYVEKWCMCEFCIVLLFLITTLWILLGLHTVTIYMAYYQVI